MSDGPELRPARPVRRRRDADGPEAPQAADARLDRLEAVVAEGFAGLERHLQGSRGGADRLEEVIELLESTIDHLIGIEQRLDALEASAAPKPPAKRTPAKRGDVTKTASTGTRARRGKGKVPDTGD